MRQFIAMAPSIYAILLHILPRRFREDFGHEMVTVFRQTIKATQQRSSISALLICWRELRDMPLLALREHWMAFKQPLRGAQGPERNISMSASVESKSEKELWNFAHSRSAWIAALPPLIFGLGGILAISIDNFVLTITIMGLSSLSIVLGGLVALGKRLPEWGYTWMGSGLMVIALSLKMLAEELDEIGRNIISPAGDLTLMALILLAGFVLLIIASRKSWQPAGLVSIGFASIFGISTVMLLQVPPFNRFDMALFAIPAGLLFAGCIYFYTRSNDFVRAIILLFSWCINLAIIYITHITWQTWFAEQGRNTLVIPLLVLSTGFIISGPFIGLIKNPLMRMLGRT